jgi:hypothetical protein
MSTVAGLTATPLICLRAVDSGIFAFTFTAFDYTVLTDKYM